MTAPRIAARAAPAPGAANLAGAAGPRGILRSCGELARSLRGILHFKISPGDFKMENGAQGRN